MSATRVDLGFFASYVLLIFFIFTRAIESAWAFFEKVLYLSLKCLSKSGHYICQANGEQGVHNTVYNLLCCFIIFFNFTPPPPRSQPHNCVGALRQTTPRLQPKSEGLGNISRALIVSDNLFDLMFLTFVFGVGTYKRC